MTGNKTAQGRPFFVITTDRSAGRSFDNLAQIRFDFTKTFDFHNLNSFPPIKRTFPFFTPINSTVTVSSCTLKYPPGFYAELIICVFRDSTQTKAVTDFFRFGSAAATDPSRTELKGRVRLDKFLDDEIALVPRYLTRKQQTPPFCGYSVREHFLDFISGYVDVHAGALFLKQHEDA